MGNRILQFGAVVFLIGLVIAPTWDRRVAASAQAAPSDTVFKPHPGELPYTPVITPNGSTLPWKMVDGVKEFRLTVEEIDWEIAPGMTIKAWGYNGQTPGPTIEAVEGDRVRIFVTNKLPEPTAVHWHGIILPSGMDGVQGLTQWGILPGDTFVYEFTLHQNGTFFYHSHDHARRENEDHARQGEAGSECIENRRACVCRGGAREEHDDGRDDQARCGYSTQGEEVAHEGQRHANGCCCHCGGPADRRLC